MAERGGARKGGTKGRGKGDTAARGSRAEVAAVVDRIEDDTAVLSLDDGKLLLDLPLSRLPEGTTDGDHLRLTFDGEPSARTLRRAAKDEESRAAAEARIRRLRERLESRSGTAGKKDFKL